MIFILDDKKYDTDKSEVVLKYREKFEGMILWGRQLYDLCPMTLYKTQKGNWFSVREIEKNGLKSYVAYKHTKASVKEILSNLNKVELIEKHFENLEEA